jgi:hypothetical protein
LRAHCRCGQRASAAAQGRAGRGRDRLTIYPSHLSTQSFLWALEIRPRIKAH